MNTRLDKIRLDIDGIPLEGSQIREFKRKLQMIGISEQWSLLFSDCGELNKTLYIKQPTISILEDEVRSLAVSCPFIHMNITASGLINEKEYVLAIITVRYGSIEVENKKEER